MSEHTEQVAVVSWFKGRWPHFADCIIGIPNGAHIAGSVGQRAAKVNKLKAEGMKPGTSDLFIAVPMGNRCGLWVEMKNVNKTLCSVSQDQRDHLDLMRKVGYEAIWCSGFEVAKAAIEVYMNGGAHEGA